MEGAGAVKAEWCRSAWPGGGTARGDPVGVLVTPGPAVLFSPGET